MTSLLPSNRTPLEAALEATSGSRFPLPTNLIAAVWNPDTCPLELLPYLAWGLSVDLWDQNWSETTKRQVCRNALTLHRLKTTLAGIKAHVTLTGATVLKAYRPPMREFRQGAMTDAQRIAWLDGLPQIRIYPFSENAIAKSRTFYIGAGVTGQWRGGVADPDLEIDITDDSGNYISGTAGPANDTGPAPTKRRFYRTSRGFDMYNKRATFYDQGVETPVTLGAIDPGFTDRVLLVRKAPWRLFYGHGFRKGYLRTSVADSNTITLAISDDNQQFPVTPGMEPVNVRSQRIAQGRIAPASRSFFGRFGGYMKASNGPLMIYDRISLLDTTRLGARRKVKSFHGFGRYGIDPFTAELQIRVPMTRTRRRSGQWNGSGFRKAPDMTPLSKAIEAVRVSKAFRDTVLINTVTYDQVKFSDGLCFGEFVFGQIREVA